MNRIRCIAWDFDGVVNNNVVDGRFVWQDALEARFGLDHGAFQRAMFGDGFWPVMRGEEDLLDRARRVLASLGVGVSAEELLDYWFETDARPCARVATLMARARRAGLVQIIATNNEDRRTRYIEDQMGFAGRVEAVFSSGRMGVAKPDPAYFRAIEAAMGLEPQAFLFIDDYAENTDAAARCGWQVHHYPEGGFDALEARLGAVI